MGSVESGAFLGLIQQACPLAQVDVDPEGVWIVVRAATPSRTQGWKLHVSATVLSANEVLCRVLPILSAEAVHFKVASEDTLFTLNQGMAGLSQVGKFITIYPEDDVQALRLALELDEATRGLAGPAVPSDRPLRPGSLVHYRYGAFRGTPMPARDGSVQWGLVGAGGELVPDERRPYYQAPSWIEDPFLAAGLAAPLPPRAVIGRRFVITSTLHATARGSLHTAVDTTTMIPYVLKRAAREGCVVPGVLEARARLRLEFAVLSALAPDVRFPRVHDLIEHDGDLYLLMDDIPGQTLSEHVIDLWQNGSGPSLSQAVVWGRELAAAVQRVHDHGYLLCDLKPNNIMVETTGRLRLLDFDAVRHLDSGGAATLGTQGFMAPERLDGGGTDLRTDVYGLGAVLYFVVTGAQPFQPLPGQALRQRPLHLLNPEVPRALAGLIMDCLDPDQAGRPASMHEVDRLLATIADARSRRPYPRLTSTARNLKAAERLANSICRTARSDSVGMWWSARPGSSNTPPVRSLYSGCAGIVLALSTLVEHLDRLPHREVLAAGARWLSETRSELSDTVPGLYNGDAGVALALLRAGQVLGDGTLVRRAVALAHGVAGQPHDHADLLSGTAGRLRCHLSLWSGTGNGDALEAAVRCGQRLVDTAEPAGNGVHWTIDPALVLPEDRPADGSPPAYLGYAHGSAGIADTLLDLAEVTGDDRFLHTAEGAARRLVELAVPVLGDRRGVAWPRIADDRPVGAFWCHGAAGIGRFFLHAARLNLVPQAEELAIASAITVARTTRWARPTLCHGLAGNMVFLLDVYRETGQSRHLQAAHVLARMLYPWLIERDGDLVCQGDEPGIFSPAYMTGYGGVAVALLRLAVPGDLPDLAPPVPPSGHALQPSNAEPGVTVLEAAVP